MNLSEMQNTGTATPRARVVVAMSGGVDSSVAAALLVQQGYDVIGIHLNFWTDPNVEELAQNIPQNKCCTLGGLEDARSVAGILGIPFYVMNVEEDFKKNVVDTFLSDHANGRTPNPCVECNRTIKFGRLIERAKELGAEFVASGHYARVVDVVADSGPGQHKTRRALLAAVDTKKDQSYFLYHLGQEKLKHVMFPIGEFTSKAEIYKLADSFGLRRVSEKPQSQGLCFFSESSPKFFLKRYLDSKHFMPGPIEAVDGRVLGQHKGLPLYTIGQRSGLGIGGVKGEPEGEPWFVVRADPDRNVLIVGREKDIMEYSVTVTDCTFVSGIAPTEPIEVLLRVRHRGELVPATLTPLTSIVGLSVASSLTYCLKTKAPIKGVAPGQAAVFYQGEEVLGGGVIVKSKVLI